MGHQHKYVLCPRSVPPAMDVRLALLLAPEPFIPRPDTTIPVVELENIIGAGDSDRSRNPTDRRCAQPPLGIAAELLNHLNARPL